VKKICTSTIRPYQDLYSHAENSSLENTEKRYGWLWRNLKEFDNKYGKIFPEYWGMHCHLIYEFCGITRIQITEMLEKRALSSNVAVLMKALESTLKFEIKIQDDMKKEYSVYLQEAKNFYREKNELESMRQAEQEREKNKERKPESAVVDKLSEKINENILKGMTQSNIRIEFMITSLPKFKGSISDSFEPYLRPYVENEEHELTDNIMKSLQNDDIDHASQIKILNSSLYLFNYIKTSLKRASQFSRSQAMFDIYRVIKRSLKLYADELTNKIAREEKVTKPKEEQLFISILCFIINTAEYCKDTLSGLAESVRQSLDSPFCEKVEFEAEEDIFSSLLNRGVESLIAFLDSKLELAFGNMLKLNWER
jgi:vacuolar protein sorting-associated protein 53